MPTDPRRIKELFDVAVQLPDPQTRQALLERECGDDVELRHRLDVLLRAHDQPCSVLDQPLAGEVAPELTGPHLSLGRQSGETAGAVIAGRYKLLEEIGEGGMGTVWVAEQTQPVRRKVALKLIKAGMDSKTVLSRFEAERQALALMDHPNIAKVLDGGSTDAGRPFFVMEYVKGVPFTKYCDNARLSIAQRLALFVPVCQAVQHAHQKGIIHRDLKPSNVLVCLYDGQPVPKVIDFGLAKAMHQPLTEHSIHTAHGAMLGTPLYMSPEQAELNNLDVDTRTDIYALGVILYELLTGTTPLEKRRFKEAAWHEMLRLIKEEEPPKPSARLSGSGTLPSVAAQRRLEPVKLTKLVRGELDWIAMKCLEKDRSRRYETANGLAMEIQRYLAGEPVLAAPPSAAYRLQKFVKRNKGPVLAASCFGGLVLAVLLGLIFGIRRLEQANQDTMAALARETDARKRTRDALDDLTSAAVKDWLAREQKMTPDQKRFLERAIERYEEFARETGNDRDTRLGVIRAWISTADIQKALAQYDQAERAARRASELAEAFLADFPCDVGGREHLHMARDRSAMSLLYRGRHMDAEAMFRRNLDEYERLLSDLPESRRNQQFNLSALHNNLGIAIGAQGRRDEAEKELRKAIAILTTLAADPRDSEARLVLAIWLSNLGSELQRVGRSTEAERELRRAVDLARQAISERREDAEARMALVGALINLSTTLSTQLRRDQAVEAVKEALPVASTLAREYPSNAEYRSHLSKVLQNLGQELARQGRFDEAERHALRAVEVTRQLHEASPNTMGYRLLLAKSHDVLAGIWLDTQRAGPAALETQTVIDLLGTVPTESLAGDAIDVPEILWNASVTLARALSSLGRHDEAVTVARQAVRLAVRISQAHPPEPSYLSKLAIAYGELGEDLASAGKMAEAEATLLEGLKEANAARQHHFDNFDLQVDVAQLQGKLGRVLSGEAALKHLASGVEIYRRLETRYPKEVRLRFYRRDLHWRRAEVLVKLGRHADAVGDWAETVQLDPGPSRPWFRAHQAQSLHRSGKPAEAAAGFVLAVQEAEAIVKVEDVQALELYDSAAVFALAAAVTPDDAESLAKRAVTLLRRAAAKGYFKDPATLATLKGNSDYAALRSRADYEKLIKELEQNPSVKP